MIWREKQILLIALGILLLVNTIFFFTYRVQYESRLEALDARRDQDRARLAEARSTRIAAEQQVAAYRKIENDVQRVFTELWSTEGARLTSLITEVKRLSVAANLVPPSTSYTRGDPRGKRGAPLGATEVGISFAVNGSYQQIRRLINMLELSRQFIIIDRLDLNTTDGERLTMNIHIKTLFRDMSPPPARVANRQL